MAGGRSRQTKKWREFEEMVARIEAYLDPKGVKVESPSRVRDNVTGAMREVDACLRYQLGSAELVVTIECRDRRGAEDVTWVEQLITKQRDIGAARTIAVSSYGFSKAAIAKAKHHKVDIRQTHQLSGEELAELFDKLRIQVRYLLYNVVHTQIVFETQSRIEDLTMEDQLLALFLENFEDNPIIFDSATGEGIPFTTLLREWQESGQSLIDEAVPLGEKYQKVLHCDFEPCVSAPTNKGKLAVSAITFTLEVSRHDDRIPFAEGLRYSNESGALACTARGTFAPAGLACLTFSAHRRPNDAGIVAVEVTSHQPEFFEKGRFIREV